MRKIKGSCNYLLSALMICLAFVTTLFPVTVYAMEVDKNAATDLNTALMFNTFLITGPSSIAGEDGKVRIGTGFVLARLQKKSADNEHAPRSSVLITAAHVFDDIKGNTATVNCRYLDDEGIWHPYPIAIKIRDDDGNRLWTQVTNSAPPIDVAAIDLKIAPVNNARLKGMIVEIPAEKILADDDALKRFNVHPGYELYCLGFPLGYSRDKLKFATLRSGPLASYPILPMRTVRSFDFDFEVFSGNSGGPVYIAKENPSVANATVLGPWQTIVGLVTQQVAPKTGIKLAGGMEERRELKLGVIIPAALIKDTLDAMPDTQ